MATVYDQAFFHILPHDSSLDRVSRNLYGNGLQGEREAFLRINKDVPVDSSGRLLTGQVLYLPKAAACRFDEPEIMDTLATVNRFALELNASERAYLARNQALSHNAASDPLTLKTVVGVANTAVNGVASAVSLEVRAVGRLLRELEQRYVSTYRLHGRLTPDFYAFRRRVYRALDSRIGRVGRFVAFQTPLSESAKRSLKVSTKSETLHWKRQPNAERVKGFETHFRNMSKVSKYLRAGGAVTIAVDGALTADTIVEACRSDERNCERTAMVEGGGFAGRTGGGIAGGTLGYLGCSVVFAPLSGGSSFLWCALLAGGAGAIAGGTAGDYFGRGAGELIYETKSSIVAP